VQKEKRKDKEKKKKKHDKSDKSKKNEYLEAEGITTPSLEQLPSIPLATPASYKLPVCLVIDLQLFTSIIYTCM
jgi:hypothetical protein